MEKRNRRQKESGSGMANPLHAPDNGGTSCVKRPRRPGSWEKKQAGRGPGQGPEASTRLLRCFQARGGQLPEEGWEPAWPSLGRREADQRLGGVYPEPQARWVQKTRSMEISQGGVLEAGKTNPGGAPLLRTQDTQVMVPYCTPDGEEGVISLSISWANIDLRRLTSMSAGPGEQKIRHSVTTSDLPSQLVEALVQASGLPSPPPWWEFIQQTWAPAPSEAAPQPAGEGVEFVDRRMDREIAGDEVQWLGRQVLEAALNAPGVTPRASGVVRRDLGIIDDSGEFAPFLRRGTPYPGRVSRLLPVDGKQWEVCLKVAEGPAAPEDERPVLGKLVLQVGYRKETSDTLLEVAFVLEADGALTVRAMDLESGVSGVLRIPPEWLHGGGVAPGGDVGKGGPGEDTEGEPAIWGPVECKGRCPKIMSSV